MDRPSSEKLCIKIKRTRSVDESELTSMNFEFLSNERNVALSSGFGSVKFSGFSNFSNALANPLSVFVEVSSVFISSLKKTRCDDKAYTGLLTRLVRITFLPILFKMFSIFT